MSKCVIKEVTIGIAKGSWNIFTGIALLALLIVGVISVSYLLGYGFCTITGIYPAIGAPTVAVYYSHIGSLLITGIAALLIVVLLTNAIFIGIKDIYKDAKRNCDN